MSIKDLTQSNINALTLAKDIISELSAESIIKIEKPYANSSVGKHFRHIIDHYLCFKRDFSLRIIDYDTRHRDPRLEVDKQYITSIINDIQNHLTTLSSHDDCDLQVIMCPDVHLPNGTETRSSLSRELIFLQSHTVHHFALIGTLLKLSGYAIDSNFGVAPSTIVHDNTVKATS